jgi:hypothetical protein
VQYAFIHLESQLNAGIMGKKVDASQNGGMDGTLEV